MPTLTTRPILHLNLDSLLLRNNVPFPFASASTSGNAHSYAQQSHSPVSSPSSSSSMTSSSSASDSGSDSHESTGMNPTTMNPTNVPPTPTSPCLPPPSVVMQSHTRPLASSSSSSSSTTHNTSDPTVASAIGDEPGTHNENVTPSHVSLSSPHSPNTQSPNMDTDIDMVDPDAIFSIWSLMTKCKDSVKGGRRLENLSWRLWYRSQSASPDSETDITAGEHAKLVRLHRHQPQQPHSQQQKQTQYTHSLPSPTSSSPSSTSHASYQQQQAQAQLTHQLEKQQSLKRPLPHSSLNHQQTQPQRFLSPESFNRLITAAVCTCHEEELRKLGRESKKRVKVGHGSASDTSSVEGDKRKVPSGVQEVVSGVNATDVKVEVDRRMVELASAQVSALHQHLQQQQQHQSLQQQLPQTANASEADAAALTALVNVVQGAAEGMLHKGVQEKKVQIQQQQQQLHRHQEQQQQQQHQQAEAEHSEQADVECEKEIVSLPRRASHKNLVSLAAKHLPSSSPSNTANELRSSASTTALKLVNAPLPLLHPLRSSPLASGSGAVVSGLMGKASSCPQLQHQPHPHAHHHNQQQQQQYPQWTTADYEYDSDLMDDSDSDISDASCSLGFGGGYERVVVSSHGNCHHHHYQRQYGDGDDEEDGGWKRCPTGPPLFAKVPLSGNLNQRMECVCRARKMERELEREQQQQREQQKKEQEGKKPPLKTRTSLLTMRLRTSFPSTSSCSSSSGGGVVSAGSSTSAGECVGRGDGDENAKYGSTSTGHTLTPTTTSSSQTTPPTSTHTHTHATQKGFTTNAAHPPSPSPCQDETCIDFVFGRRRTITGGSTAVNLLGCALGNPGAGVGSADGDTSYAGCGYAGKGEEGDVVQDVW